MHLLLGLLLAASVDGEAALRHASALAALGPHPWGSPRNEAAAQYVAAELRERRPDRGRSPGLRAPRDPGHQRGRHPPRAQRRDDGRGGAPRHRPRGPGGLRRRRRGGIAHRAGPGDGARAVPDPHHRLRVLRRRGVLVHRPGADRGLPGLDREAGSGGAADRGRARHRDGGLEGRHPGRAPHRLSPTRGRAAARSWRRPGWSAPSSPGPGTRGARSGWGTPGSPGSTSPRSGRFGRGCTATTSRSSRPACPRSSSPTPPSPPSTPTTTRPPTPRTSSTPRPSSVWARGLLGAVRALDRPPRGPAEEPRWFAASRPGARLHRPARPRRRQRPPRAPDRAVLAAGRSSRARVLQAALFGVLFWRHPVPALWAAPPAEPPAPPGPRAVGDRPGGLAGGWRCSGWAPPPGTEAW